MSNPRPPRLVVVAGPRIWPTTREGYGRARSTLKHNHKHRDVIASVPGAKQGGAPSRYLADAADPFTNPPNPPTPDDSDLPSPPPLAASAVSAVTVAVSPATERQAKPGRRA